MMNEDVSARGPGTGELLEGWQWEVEESRIWGYLPPAELLGQEPGEWYA